MSIYVLRFFFWSLGCWFPNQITHKNNKYTSSGWVNLMHINILVKYMTAKCLQNQPDILWYKNGTDKMNVRHQREKNCTHELMMKLHISWWCHHILHEHEMSWLANQSTLYKKNVTCRYIVLQKINYHIGKKKITQQNFRSNIQRHCQHSYNLRYFFLLIWHNFSHQIICSRYRLYIIHQKPKFSRFYFFLSLFLYIFFFSFRASYKVQYWTLRGGA